MNGWVCKGVMVATGTVEVGEASASAGRGRGRGQGRTPPAIPLPSPTRSIRRGLMAMSLCWQALVMGPDPAFWPTSHAGTLLVIPIGLAWGTWLALLGAFVMRWPSQAVRLGLATANVVLLLVAGAGMLLQTASTGALSEGFAPGASLVNLGVGLAGMLLATILARWLTLAAVAAEALIVLAPWQGGAPSARDAVLYPLYAVAIGAGAAGARRALMRAATRHEAALAELRQARVMAAAVTRIRRELSRQERLIHESVLNTLAAIARGGLPADSGAVRAQAAAGAVVLGAIADRTQAGLVAGTGRWESDLRASVQYLRSRGISASVEVLARADQDPRTMVSEEAYEALLVGAREALCNVERHAQASAVVVRVSQTSARFGRPAMQVQVVDDGVGFDMAATNPRFGLTESIESTIGEVGGWTSVESAPGAGTTVRMTVPRAAPVAGGWWRRLAADADSALHASTGTIPMGNAAFARPVLAWFAAFVLASAMSTLAMDQRPGLTVLALALVGLLGSGLWLLSSRPMLPAWFIGLAAVAAPLVYRLQVAATGVVPPSHWEDWSSEAIAVFWLVVTAIGPWWTVMVALPSWLIMQQNTWLELLQPGTAIILAGAVFARSVRRNNRAFAVAEVQRTEEMAAVLAESQGLERMRARHDLLGQSAAQALLEGVAHGLLDPADEGVQRECGGQERFIRSVMRLDPAADLVHLHAGRIAVQAHRLGISLDISLSETKDWPEVACERFFAEVSGMLPSMDPGTVARLTARREGDALAMRFVSGDGMEALEVRHA